MLRDLLRKQNSGLTADEIEDLAQEALIDLVRFARRQHIDNLPALLNTFAKRRAADLYRRRARWRRLQDPLLAEGHASPAADLAHIERLAFAVLRYLESVGAPCTELARLHMHGHEWQEVAQQRGSTVEAIRKQWSRCLARFRQALETSSIGGTLTPWLRFMTGGRDE
jgi:DNA-directed RNA polymerase specialized sigma24 family protein